MRSAALALAVLVSLGSAGSLLAQTKAPAPRPAAALRPPRRSRAAKPADGTAGLARTRRS